MKIAHIVFGFKVGGIETMLVNITREQSRAGHEVNLVIINNLIDGELLESVDKSVNIFEIGRPVGSKNPIHILRLNRTLRSIKADVIHIHKAKIINWLLPSFKKISCVTQHEILVADDIKPIKHFRQIFAISNAVRENVLEATGLDSKVITNGIEVARFEKSNKVYDGNGLLRCVCIGRLEHDKKGQHLLLEALGKLDPESKRRIHVDFWGDGSSMNILRAMSVEYGISDNVSFQGNVSQEYLYQHLKDYDLLVLPSLYEGFGLTVAEAMAARVPVLVSDINGPREIVDNGRYGTMFKASDSDDCALRLRIIMQGGISKELVDKAEERVINEYSVRKTVKQYLESYESLDRQ